eukprot:m.102682 g.102682  ORF g.102682 m.102682 type:complete len:343 (+) comp13778_c0_seq6:355-1383(+)
METIPTSNKILALSHAAMTFAAVSFGGLNIFVEIISRFHNISPFEEYCRLTAFVLYRHVCGGILLSLAAFYSFHGHPSLQVLRTCSPWVYLVLQGFTGVYLGQFLFVIGLGHTSANTAAIMQPLAPVVVVFLGVLLGFEKITFLKCFAILVGVGGSVIMVYPVIMEPSRGDFLGMIFLIAGVCGNAAYLLLMKQTYSVLPPIVMAALQYASACVFTGFSFVPCIYHGHGKAITHPGVDHDDRDRLMTWVATAYAIIICSAVNYAFMAAANKFLEASTCGLYGLVQPIATVALSYAIFGDLVKVHDLIGAVCICLGLILVSRAQLSEQRRQYTLIDGEGSEIN